MCGGSPGVSGTETQSLIIIVCFSAPAAHFLLLGC